MATLNIVDLIENNPITKLSSSYNNKLITKMQENFNESQQQLFVSSFYCYLKYDQKQDFVIDLDDVWKWLQFYQKQKSKELLTRHFVINKDYKVFSPNKKDFNSNDNLLTLEGEKKKNKGRGGHNKIKYMLNIKTFKALCLKAGTKKADEIHDYYLKMEEILQQIVQEESDELKIQLQNKQIELEEIEVKKEQEYRQKLAKEKEIERHKILLREFGNIGSLVYILKVKSYNNGHYIIKIGESRRGVEGRINEHKLKYEECYLLDCFLVNRSKDFESFLHNHPDIKFNKVNDLPGHQNERELFLVGKELSYHMLINIINSNILYYQQYSNKEVEDLRQECQQLRQLNNIQKKEDLFTVLNQIVDSKISVFFDQLNHKIDKLEKINQDILQKCSNQLIKTTTNFNLPLNTLGPRLQKINPETLELVQVYESVSQCMKENYSFKRPSINKAIQENTIYGGYRWLLVDRELDPKIITNIMPTKKTLIKDLGYIAKLNKDKTEIINVYIDRKTAASYNQYQSLSALDNPVKKGTQTNGFYYIIYDKCDEDLKDNFLKKHNINQIILYKDGLGQYDLNHNLIREFVCKYDCIRSLRISDKTLAKSMSQNIAYQDYFYYSLGSKLYI